MRRRLASVVGLAAAVALVATSPPPEYFYQFLTTVEPPAVELTAEAPSSTLRLHIRATGLAPNGASTTNGARALIEGRVSSEGLAAGGTGAFVLVRTSDGRGDAGSRQISALTEFALASDLVFEGDCTGLSESDPCEAELFIELRREDSGLGAGSIRVEWGLELTAQARKGEEGPGEGPFEPPWEITLEPVP